ncbi:hypothetical protein J7L68_01940 [bacterium]|nr:hypothetical protein [bacterium]
MHKLILMVCILFFVIFVRGIENEDSLWIHIENVKPDINKADKVEFLIQWSIYDSPFEDSAYGDWYLVENENHMFLIQCSADSEFEKLIYSDSTDANNIVFDGLDIDREYFLRVKILNSKNPMKSDVASGGYFTRYARARQTRRDAETDKFYIVVGISTILIILGFGIMIFYLIRQKSKT